MALFPALKLSVFFFFEIKSRAICTRVAEDFDCVDFVEHVKIFMSNHGTKFRSLAKAYEKKKF